MRWSGRDPLSEETVEELRRSFDQFHRLDDIRGASWGYCHDHNCSHWAQGPWLDAVAELDELLNRVVESGW
ncbi:hypothetical protein OHR86_00195 [Streptomyces sp. NBC_00441]|uniref:hypothetical protein n=1 Tax=Streptomyces sp. NBC_00441 TaxID=2975742 RepID=UPI002E2CDB07|nr:hypothetical protein [Streptomyces sp. NBC_00441]